ncbi:hypothetical protein YC2023_091200 [Brassica napus]
MLIFLVKTALVVNVRYEPNMLRFLVKLLLRLTTHQVFVFLVINVTKELTEIKVKQIVAQNVIVLSLRSKYGIWKVID